jgi:hypothetical protein
MMGCGQCEQLKGKSTRTAHSPQNNRGYPFSIVKFRRGCLEQLHLADFVGAAPKTGRKSSLSGAKPTKKRALALVPFQGDFDKVSF